MRRAGISAAAPSCWPAGGRMARSGPSSLAAARTVATAGVHAAQPGAISLTQATECGTVYAPRAIRRDRCRRPAPRLRLHMDGARWPTPSPGSAAAQPRRPGGRHRRAVARRHQERRAGAEAVVSSTASSPRLRRATQARPATFSPSSASSAPARAYLTEGCGSPNAATPTARPTASPPGWRPCRG